MSVAPPPAYPTWPPQPYPPAPPPRQRRWPAIAAAAGIGAIIAGTITTLVTLAATSPTPSTAAAPPPTVTVTAEPPPQPTPLPVAQADAQTCHAWGTADRLVTAAATAQNVIPRDLPIDDPSIQSNPAWKAGALRSSELLGQAARTFDSQIAAGTNPTLAQVSQTTVSSLLAMSEANRAFDPVLGKSFAVFQANQKALDGLCP
uniref:Alanine and proline rich membrane protein n=2 Tax=unclassified Mycobacterium TaxID=2642494 RepID=A0A5Q5BT32_MYCSS